MRISTSMRWLVVAVSAAMLLAVAAACSSETIEVPGETVVVEKEVIKTVEVPGETVVKEVVKEVQVPGETVVVKEVVTETVEVPGETVVVEKEVVKTVEVPGETVTVEVVKEVQVPGETVVVEKEVVKTVEVPGETVVVTKEVAVPVEVVREVPGKNYVTDPTTGKVVSAPEYGGTITNTVPSPNPVPADPYVGYTSLTISGVVEKLGIGNWGVDRDVHDFKSFLPVSFVTGRLAERWDISPDGLTYTFPIRQGVRWHDKAPMNGRELTAHDIEYNFHRVLGMGDFAEAGPTPFGGAASLKAIPWESVTATDKWTVVIELTKPYLPALGLILLNDFAYIMPPEVIEQHGDVLDWRNLVGTGPFMLTDVVEGSSKTYTKNPDYWGFDPKYPQNRLPYVDEYRVLVIPEEATIMAALRSRKIDLKEWVISMDSVLSLQRTNPEIAVHTLWARSSDSFAPNHRVPPFNDINVVRAMQMALDNETIAATLWKGQADATPMGRIANKGHYIPFEEWPEEVKQYYRYDPEAAEKLLDEAGYPRGADGTRFKTSLTYGAWASLEYAEIAASYWAEIGVDVEIDALTHAEYNDRLFSRTYEGMISAIAGAAYDPVMFVGRYQSDAMWNRGGHQWPELDAIIEAALNATTIEEQQRLIAEADMYAIEKHFQIWGPKSPVYFLAQPWLIGYNGERRLAGFETHTLVAYLWIDSELKEEMGY